MSTPTIENIIVVMLENRSYDNMLGGLYMSSNPPPYNQAPSGQANLNGLTGTEWNPNQNSGGDWYVEVNNQTGPTQVNGSGAYYPPTTIPVIDPGELFSDMAYQINGEAQSTNPYVSWSPAAPPASPPSTEPSPLPQMSGFTGDYASQSGYSVEPTGNNINDVMNYFTPSQVPVTAWLANNFGVCDQWYASAPTQTFTNRVFAHCAAPAVYIDGLDSSKNYSMVDDAQYVESITGLPSIFSLLDAAYPDGQSPNWKVYFHDYSISMLTVPYVMQKALSPQNVNVATYDNTDWGTATPQPVTELTTLTLQVGQTPLGGAVPSTFLEDLEKGTLPMYSFIEPRYSNGIVYGTNPPQRITLNSYPPNSNHPGGANYPAIPNPFGTPAPLNPVSPSNPPIDVADGEAFLKQLYNALQQSSYWGKTLLIITYDEHGGCYDHVPPPAATPPGQTTNTPSLTIPAASGNVVDTDEDPTADGFTFNVYGCRVPTIVVSPYIAAGTRITPTSGTFDHTSIIRTIWDCFITNGTPPVAPTVTSLTQRDAEGSAASLYPSLDFSIFNNPGQL